MTVDLRSIPHVELYDCLCGLEFTTPEAKAAHKSDCWVYNPDVPYTFHYKLEPTSPTDGDANGLLKALGLDGIF